MYGVCIFKQKSFSPTIWFIPSPLPNHPPWHSWDLQEERGKPGMREIFLKKVRERPSEWLCETG
jgi:hypothetical protein